MPVEPAGGSGFGRQSWAREVAEDACLDELPPGVRGVCRALVGDPAALRLQRVDMLSGFSYHDDDSRTARILSETTTAHGRMSPPAPHGPSVRSLKPANLQRRQWNMYPRKAALSLSFFVALTACASGGPRPAETLRSLNDAGDASGSVPLMEMDLTNKVFVEWYLSALGQVAEELIATVSSSEARKQASLLRFEQGASAYAIAAGPNPYVQLLNLVAMIELERIEWIEEGRARAVFGDRAPVLEATLAEANERVWSRARAHLTPAEVTHLEELIHNWRERNPELISLSFIRLADFAHELAVSMTTFRADRGILSRIAETNREIDEARLLGERAMYLAERSPMLLGWRLEAIVSDLMTHPDLAGVWERLDEITGTAVSLEARLGNLETVLESLPADVIVTLSEEVPLRAALNTVAGVGPVLDQLAPAVLGLERSLGRIAALADEIDAAFAPEALRAEADLGAQRLVREVRGLILLTAVCAAALIVLFFTLRRLTATPIERRSA